MNDEPRLRIPLDWVVVDAIGALLTGLGVLGLTGNGARLLPILERPAVAAACVVLGVVLMGLSLVQILRHMRDSARRPRR